MSRSGADLALLLLGGYRRLVDEAMAQLDEQGFEDFRPAHEFALRTIASGADNASELGRGLAVSKQAAAKTIATLLDRGYVMRDADPKDARRKHLAVTPRGFEVMRQGEAVFERLREEWSERLGHGELEKLESTLARLVGDAAVRPVAPGWIAQA
ncbi:MULTISPECIES: MarR family winged helix-turn-helix transcriptional regulator [unclassified Arthrobacter]|uniref:MarR family winged helix-turn-helix transcriptional regulator n=1 Tax=unclassified Arthrobacter TaxID=235627 RepID=UPI001E468D68|nr:MULTISPECIES: MarR family winged helix-turn-helix transcriptional regulator [unclassified Arthrobacter]MCC9146791.1 MarR family winged helix-turn-helix transcriptional regulator [Arthrobacter sp. zg-Y919]MDK1278022.1 MarR family winged helix-turn-helix transcriptional regulator [Arthrobacter sp. zg.Y919]WIB03388.1 MarR family winged helix-turn-helix transcriptional regulator [Arthrobacter sp. zg-Y919]